VILSDIIPHLQILYYCYKFIQIRIVAHVGVLSNSTDLVGELIPVAGTVDISGEHLWVGYMDSTVVDESSALNDNVSDNYSALYWLLLDRYKQVVLLTVRTRTMYYLLVCSL